ncbi:DUF2778 domain-containing protein [Methylomonas sp. LW13]|uniref:RHS repeat-associated core domain-containing protein n=1 Tax=unclassified Methylomonas TaxID=2608980 RepID=UPI0009FD8ADE|nr:RHS repeat-associated core domain-containing protein [Methylomonas sp. LW13]QBC28050.1 DUF2778 domain-containing protein [Methylomonas sp. LW13]
MPQSIKQIKYENARIVDAYESTLMWEKPNNMPRINYRILFIYWFAFSAFYSFFNDAQAGWIVNSKLGCFETKPLALNVYFSYENPDSISSPGTICYRDSCSNNGQSTGYNCSGHCTYISTGGSVYFSWSGTYAACSNPIDKAKNGGGDNCLVMTPNPVNSATGNKYWKEVDYKNASGDLSFTRTYNSDGISLLSVNGYNWINEFDSQILLSTNNGVSTAVVYRPDGRYFRFTKSDTLWISDSDVILKLEQLYSGTTFNGWQIKNSNDDLEIYDVKGKLIKIQKSNGRFKTLTYSNSSTSVTVAPKPDLLIKVTDSFGNSINFTYYATGQMATLSDPAGNVYQYSYTSSDNLKEVIYPGVLPNNPRKLYIYGGDTGESINTSGTSQPHALTGIFDEKGVRYATYKYDVNGKVIRTEHAGGVDQYNLQYALDERSSSITDPLGTVRSSHFTASLGVLKSTGSNQPAGAGCPASGSALNYDINGNIASRADFNGNLSCHAYDLNRNLETTLIEGVASAGNCPANASAYVPTATSNERKVSRAWHPDWRLETQRAEPYKLTTWVYNGQPDPSNGNAIASCAPTSATLSNGKPLAVLCKAIEQATTDANGALGLAATATGDSRVWRYTYNNLGQVLTVDGPRTDANDITTYSYYSDRTASHKPGDLNTVTNALSHVTTFNNYDANGRPLTMTDPNGLVVNLSYDARGRLTQRTVDGNTTQYTYDAIGNLTKVTRPTGVYVTYSYDAAHRLTDITDALGGKIHYTLDAIGNRIKEDILDSSGNIVKTHSRVYDALNRLAQDIGAYNQTTHYQYDANGNLTKIIDANGHATQHQYDSLDRLIRTTDALAGLTDYQYNGQDRLTQVTDANNHSTLYSYNGLGDLTQLESPNTGITQYSYDSAGNLLQKTDAGNISATYSYDALNRLLGIDYPGTEADVVNLYDGGTTNLANQKGRLSNTRRGDIDTTQRFDLRGNLVGRSVKATGTNTLISDISYHYSADNQLTETQPSASRSIQNVYDGAGQVQQVQVVDVVSGITTTRVLADAVNHLPFGPVTSLNYGNGLMLDRSYDLDYRLTAQSVGILQNINYGYDNAGNLQTLTDNLNAANSQTYTYDPLDRILTVSGTQPLSYSYDAVGNRSIALRGQAQTDYHYDLSSQKLLSLTGTPTISLSHTPQGHVSQVGNHTLNYAADQRLTSVAQGNTSLGSYRYDAFGHRIGKTTALNSTYYGYDQQDQMISESLGGSTQQTVYLDGQPLARIDGNNATSPIVYFHNHHLGAPQTVSDQTQQSVWNAQLDPFGQVTTVNPNITQNLRFPGQYYDQETGWHYNYHRYYQPDLGRYLQSDPIGLTGGINTYPYALNNPLKYIDPKGLTSLYYDTASQILSVYPEQPSQSSYFLTATSGRPDCIGCDASTPNKGAIPSGNYTLNAQDISNPNAIGDLIRNLPGVGADWGDWRGPLTPNRGTNTFGRSGFFLHGGSIKGSAGCVDVGGGVFGNSSTNQLLNDIKKDPDGIIPLIVK